ncbi:MAG: N-acetyltransferase [Acidobacteriota bacterium]
MARDLTLRDSVEADRAAIRRVHLDAFPGPAEADLVDRLLDGCPERISCVALDGDEIVGHILFTPATADGGAQGLGLAPLAVLTSHQRSGVGAALTELGLDLARRAGYPFVVVLGHPEYYPRFGFRPASRFGVECPYPDVPDDAFMLLVFDDDRAPELSGVVRYRPEFG